MGIRTGVTILASLVHGHVSAHLSLSHLFDFLVELGSLLSAIEMLFLGLSSGLADCVTIE